MILLLLLFNGFVLYLVLEMIAGFFIEPVRATHAVHGAKEIAHVHNASHVEKSAHSGFNGFYESINGSIQSHIYNIHHIQNFHHFFNYYHQYINAVFALLIICGLALLFNSNAGQWLLRFICGARKAIDREQKRIYPVIARVQQAVEKQLGIKAIKKIHLMIFDDPMPNAAVVGKNTLIISRSLYEIANEEELAGVMAHELAHLHNGDSMRLGAALGVSTITLVISSIAVFLYSIVSMVSNLFSKGKDEMSIFAVVFGLVFTLFLWIFLLFIKCGNWIIDLALLLQGRKEEYKADKFAVKAGFGVGLLSFLEKIKDFNMEGRRTIADKLYATHPPAMLRIGKLEEYLKTVE